MDLSALFNIEYGLFVATTKLNDKDNGCIVNTVMQVTNNPCQIAVAINKNNYTCKLVQQAKKINISILTQETKFDTIKNFGFQTGVDVDKFVEFNDVERAKNDILYINKGVNSVICAEVKNEVDLGSHILFVCEITDTIILSKIPSLTYSYYHQNIKPKPQQTVKKGWRCKICGYIYEGDEMPQDYICPICKHGVVDFEKL